MPVSSAVRERCRGLLRPGENIRYIFPALSPAPPGLSHYLVAVTDTAVMVISTRFLTRDEPHAVFAAHPRRTRLGPVDLSRRPTIDVAGMTLEIDGEYAAVVAAADAEVFAPETLPADPLPDL